jgi:hypothetical protein
VADEKQVKQQKKPLFVDDSDAPVQLDEPDSGVDANGDLHAPSVSISQGGARDVYAEQVTISQGGAGNVRADNVSVSLGGIAVARTHELTLHEGGSAFAVTADNVTVEPGGRAFLLLARSASGDARVVDIRTALATGAGIGIVLWLLRRR